MKTPKIHLTKSQFLALRPCAEGLRFVESCGFDFNKAYRTAPRGDWLLWLLRRCDGSITKPQAVEIAVAIAEKVLVIFENREPNDKRPRAAIEATKAWIANPTEANKTLASAARCEARKAAKELWIKWRFAAAAADAADAAAADAADADADAAADAAADADAAYWSIRLAERETMHKWTAKTVRAIVKNPFAKGVL